MEQSVYLLVYYDDKKGNLDTEGMNPEGIVHFLKEEGFICKAGFWGCPWYFVDINNKKFKPGRPGVKYGIVIGDHAITFGEFKTIYSIYKKYKGLEVLKMGNGQNEVV